MRSVQEHTKAFISFHLTFQNKTKQLALFCWSVDLCNHKKTQQATINMTLSNSEPLLKVTKKNLIWKVTLILRLHTTCEIIIIKPMIRNLIIF